MWRRSIYTMSPNLFIKKKGRKGKKREEKGRKIYD